MTKTKTKKPRRKSHCSLQEVLFPSHFPKSHSNCKVRNVLNSTFNKYDGPLECAHAAKLTPITSRASK